MTWGDTGRRQGCFDIGVLRTTILVNCRFTEPASEAGAGI